ncbi:MAG: hypothetical protein R3247_06000 [Rhodothermales bacterium]|nr:hypothetical protein [Rhodothermales bacterium]
MTPQKIAEVIASSTRAFEAEVYREAAPPPFGSWVRVPQPGGRVLYGLVSHVAVSPVEPTRRAVAFGKTEDELRRELPQVFELLRTTLHAQVLAYREAGGAVRQTLPPHPAALHAFVYPCPDDEACDLGAPHDYLRTLVRHADPAVPVDDLLVAVLSTVYRAHGGRHGGEPALVGAARALSRLLDDDHERLQSILRRIA